MHCSVVSCITQLSSEDLNATLTTVDHSVVIFAHCHSNECTSTVISMSSFDPSLPPLIEETLLKKRRGLDELALRRSETLTNPNKRKRVIRGEDVKIKRPEQFIREARIKEGSLKKMNRRKSVVEAHTRGTIVPKSQIKKTVGVAVRIHGGRHSNEIIKAELKALGLNKKYDAVFVKLDNDGIGE